LIDFDDVPRHGNTPEVNTRRSPTNSTGSDAHSGASKQQSPPSAGSTPPDRQRRTSQSVPPFASSPANSSITSGSAPINEKPPIPAPPIFPKHQEVDEDQTDSDSDGIGSPADLNDLDEFPPLNQPII